MDPRHEIGRAAIVGEQPIDVEMIASRPATGAELDRLNPERPHLLEHLRLIQLAEHRREQSELHDARTLVQTPPARWLASTASTMQAA